jgi:hypothetical protein
MWSDNFHVSEQADIAFRAANTRSAKKNGGYADRKAPNECILNSTGMLKMEFRIDGGQINETGRGLAGVHDLGIRLWGGDRPTRSNLYDAAQFRRD